MLSVIGTEYTAGSSPPVIRIAQKEDLPALIRIIRDVFEEYDMIFHPEEELPDFYNFESHYADRDHTLYILQVNGQPAGCGALKFDGDEAVISRVYVGRPYRGKGLGRYLVRYLMNQASSSGFTRFCLWTDTRFEIAHKMYESLGFRKSGHTRPLGDINDSYEFYFEAEI